jgi:hypothetical protein
MNADSAVGPDLINAIDPGPAERDSELAEKNIPI